MQSDQNDDINDAHWFNYLNELAKEPDGVIISSNLAKALGLKVGDSLNYSRYVPELSMMIRSTHPRMQRYVP